MQTSRAGGKASLGEDEEDKLIAAEGHPSSVWGLCLCIKGVRHAEDMPLYSLAYNSTHNSKLMENKEEEEGIVVDDGVRWSARCKLFGHNFIANLPPSTKNRITTTAISHNNNTSAAETANLKRRGNVVVGDTAPLFLRSSDGKCGKLNADRKRVNDLLLAGVEAHAYLQCGVSRLRQAFQGAGAVGRTGGYRRARCGDDENVDADDDGGRCGAVLNVELLHGGGARGGSDGRGEKMGANGECGSGAAVRYRCEVRGSVRRRTQEQTRADDLNFLRVLGHHIWRRPFPREGTIGIGQVLRETWVHITTPWCLVARSRFARVRLRFVRNLFRLVPTWSIFDAKLHASDLQLEGRRRRRVGLPS